MSDIAISFDKISKQYRLGTIGTGTISHDLNRWWQTTVLRKEDPYLKVGEINDRSIKGTSDYVWAIKDITFDVKQGEVLGIIGKNGAGKSTLLKILSRVTSPSTGTIKAKGRIASLLEVGTGFHPEMTGRENIFMNGAIMGMTKDEIKRKLDEIVDFAGIERYIDTPVKRYSSGMTVRLGFAVAAHLEPEILVVDEVLAVGDAEFQKKAIGKMKDVSRTGGRTVLFVSHNMGAVSQLCTDALFLQNGMIEARGNVSDIIDLYLSERDVISIYERKETSNKPVYFKKIYTCDETNTHKVDFTHDQDIYINFELGINDPNFVCDIFVVVMDSQEKRVFSCESPFVSENMRLKINSILVRGNYVIQAFVNVPKVLQVDLVEFCCPFTVTDVGSVMLKHGTYDYGAVFAQYEWSKL